MSIKVNTFWNGKCSGLKKLPCIKQTIFMFNIVIKHLFALFKQYFTKYNDAPQYKSMFKT